MTGKAVLAHEDPVRNHRWCQGVGANSVLDGRPQPGEVAAAKELRGFDGNVTLAAVTHATRVVVRRRG